MSAFTKTPTKSVIVATAAIHVAAQTNKSKVHVGAISIKTGELVGIETHINGDPVLKGTSSGDTESAPPANDSSTMPLYFPENLNKWFVESVWKSKPLGMIIPVICTRSSANAAVQHTCFFYLECVGLEWYIL